MELLATLDWLVYNEGIKPERSAIRNGLNAWPGGRKAAERKQRLFDDRLNRVGASAVEVLWNVGRAMPCLMAFKGAPACLCNWQCH
jgi:hypothetical protein